MKKVFLILTTLALSLLSVNASEKELPVFESYHKNIYGELFGSNIVCGVNYDMRLKKGRMDGIGFRAGIGGVSLSGSDNQNSASIGLVTFPLEFNHLLGKRRSSFITGVGLLPVYAALSANGEITNHELLQVEGFGLAGGFLTLGYRFQPLKTGVMFQVNWNPLILRGSGFTAGWIGLGLGIGFK